MEILEGAAVTLVVASSSEGHLQLEGRGIRTAARTPTPSPPLSPLQCTFTYAGAAIVCLLFSTSTVHTLRRRTATWPPLVCFIMLL